MVRTTIAILNWNGKSFLEKFLPNVIQFSESFAKVVIIDNASTDDSIVFLTSNYPDIEVLKITTNLGYAGGYNYALARLEADYFVLLNTDIEVSENWIQPVIELMEKDKYIAACQPKILSYYEPHKFEYAGAAGGFIDKYGYPFCRGRIFQTLEKDDGQYDDVREIFWATGACMFVRADLFKKFGGFDTDFFAHMEEIDLCWRFKNEEYKIMYCSESKIYHIGGGTLPKSSAEKTYLNFRNNIVLVYKNLPKNKLFTVFIIRLILDGIAGFKFLLEGHYKDSFAVFRAHNYFYTTYPKQRKKRKQITHKKHITQIYNRNIVADYYLKGKKKFSELKF